MVGAQPGVGERDGGEAGVPDGRLAGLDHPRAVLAPDREPVEGLQAGPHDGMLQVVPEEVEGDDGVDGRRLDAAPAAVVLLALDDPPGGDVHGGAADPARGEAVVDVQRLVEPLEDPVPAGGRGERPVRVRPRRVGVQFVQREGRGPDRALRGDDGERHDRLPGPAAEVVDVEREPLRQEEQLRRQLGQVLPAPPAEEGQPDPGEDPAPAIPPLARTTRRRGPCAGPRAGLRRAAAPHRPPRWRRARRVRRRRWPRRRPRAARGGCGGRRRGWCRRRGCPGTGGAEGPRRPW
ncbi:hypothetical protein STANM309S_01357 [Streptomyces tanashiensis]